MKIVCYGVREPERPFFTSLNEQFNYELVLIPELLTHDNIETAKGADAVMLRGNCIADKKNLDAFKSYGIEYVLTRTVGVNHIDLDYAHSLGFKMARVPAYSPNAVSELAFSLGVAMLRNDFYMAEKFRNRDLIVDDYMFAKEVRNSTVGIVGTGRIGAEVAKAFHGMGAKVLGYDVYPNKANESYLTYVDLDTLKKESDLISIHTPYFPGKNDHMIDADFLKALKANAVLVNAARGELVDLTALYDALTSGHLRGAALDTIEKETTVFFKSFGEKGFPNEIVEKLHSLYPKVIMTPHVGSYTDEAVKNMVEISYQNLDEFIKTNDCKNKI